MIISTSSLHTHYEVVRHIEHAYTRGRKAVRFFEYLLAAADRRREFIPDGLRIDGTHPAAAALGATQELREMSPEYISKHASEVAAPFDPVRVFMSAIELADKRTPMMRTEVREAVLCGAVAVLYSQEALERTALPIDALKLLAVSGDKPAQAVMPAMYLLQQREEPRYEYRARPY